MLHLGWCWLSKRNLSTGASADLRSARCAQHCLAPFALVARDPPRYDAFTMQRPESAATAPATAIPSFSKRIGIETLLFLEEHSWAVAMGGGSRQLELKTCGFSGFARPIHEPSSSIAGRLWALAPAQHERPAGRGVEAALGQAAWNRSTRRAGDLGGARADKCRLVR